LRVGQQLAKVRQRLARRVEHWRLVVIAWLIAEQVGNMQAEVDHPFNPSRAGEQVSLSCSDQDRC
jgi:hypothetical protein